MLLQPILGAQAEPAHRLGNLLGKSCCCGSPRAPTFRRWISWLRPGGRGWAAGRCTSPCVTWWPMVTSSRSGTRRTAGSGRPTPSCSMTRCATPTLQSWPRCSRPAPGWRAAAGSSGSPRTGSSTSRTCPRRPSADSPADLHRSRESPAQTDLPSPAGRSLAGQGRELRRSFLQRLKTTTTHVTTKAPTPVVVVRVLQVPPRPRRGGDLR